MDENLDKIKERLIKEHYEQERRNIINQLRVLIYNQAILDAQFPNLEIRDDNVITAISVIMEELQSTSQEEMQRAFEATTQPLAPFWRFPGATNLKKCHRCQEYHLAIQLQQCNPFLSPHRIDDPLDPKYGYYCKSCIRAVQNEQLSKLMDETVHCNMCQKSFKRHELLEERQKFQDTYKAALKSRINMLPGGNSCFACMQQYVKLCCLCNGQYISPRADDGHEVCTKCRTPKIIEESRRVILHNERAVGLHLIADLTLPQWLATLKYFDNRCAYCSGPYIGLEHYLPLSLGGSTTASNCLPSCSSCNARKGDRHPDTFHRLFPADNLANIQAWLGV